VDICHALGVSAGDVIGLALQRAEVEFYTSIQINLDAVVRDNQPELQPQRRWAQYRLAEDPNGSPVARLERAVQRGIRNRLVGHPCSALGAARIWQAIASLANSTNAADHLRHAGRQLIESRLPPGFCITVVKQISGGSTDALVLLCDVDPGPVAPKAEQIKGQYILKVERSAGGQSIAHKAFCRQVATFAANHVPRLVMGAQDAGISADLYEIAGFSLDNLRTCELPLQTYGHCTAIPGPRKPADDRVEHCGISRSIRKPAGRGWDSRATWRSGSGSPAASVLLVRCTVIADRTWPHPEGRPRPQLADLHRCRGG
jgi:hypothetical protein